MTPQEHSLQIRARWAWEAIQHANAERQAAEDSWAAWLSRRLESIQRKPFRNQGIARDAGCFHGLHNIRTRKSAFENTLTSQVNPQQKPNRPLFRLIREGAFRSWTAREALRAEIQTGKQMDALVVSLLRRAERAHETDTVQSCDVAHAVRLGR
jgi:hypothetical protein